MTADHVQQATFLGSAPPFWFLIPAPPGIKSGEYRARKNELAEIRGMLAGSCWYVAQMGNIVSTATC